MFIYNKYIYIIVDKITLHRLLNIFRIRVSTVTNIFYPQDNNKKNTRKIDY